MARAALAALAAFVSVGVSVSAMAQNAAPVPAPLVPYAVPPFVDQTSQASGADLAAVVAKTSAELKASGKGFLWQPLLKDGENTAAVEYWQAEGRPAIHPTEGEYAVVLEGEGTLVTGGTLLGARLVRPGFVDGDRIEGGTTRPIKKGDWFLIPRGVPHWFGIPKGQMLVLLGIKVPTTHKP